MNPPTIVPSEGIAYKSCFAVAQQARRPPLAMLLATSIVAYRCGLRFPHASEAVRSLSDSDKNIPLKVEYF